MPMLRTLMLNALLAAVFAAGCGPSGPAPAAVTKVIERRMVALGKASTEVGGERLLERKAVTRVYQARQGKAAWDRKDEGEIVEAIQGVAQDGLEPRDYHLAAIEKRVADEKPRTPETQADLDILITDAVAALADHIRYGRVQPATLNPEWNADPRDDAPPLEKTVDEIIGASSVRDAIASQRPNHFIYQGLIRTLAQMRGIESKGGWKSVPAGRRIKPGTSDPRIPAVRARLIASGEIDGPASESTTYDDALRKAVVLFQGRHRLEGTGVIDPVTIGAMNVGVGYRAAQVRANLERARWVLAGLGDDFMLVNLPAFKAYRIQNGKNIWESRTQIGDEAKRTPTFRANIRIVVFNPDWTVPPTIIAEEILPAMQEGKDAIAGKGLKIFDQDNKEVDPSSIDWGSITPETFPYTLRQPPEEDNALGRVKFLFPNKYSIYLHDTPSRHLFSATIRTFSHGCIRLENPLELAEILLKGQDGWNKDKIDEVLASGELTNVELEHPVPIIIVYWTVSVGASSEVRYAEDVYDLDPPLIRALSGPPPRR